MASKTHKIAIKTSNLTKKYGAKAAVKNLNIEIAKGEVFGFLGPNGAGKTTTIKMLCGIFKPNGGTVEIAGIDIFKEPERAKQKIGYLPESPVLYEKLTPIEQLDFVAKLYNIPPAERKKRIKYVLDMFGLSAVGNDYLESYSKGMKQKVALAQSFLHEPEILFLDEPTSGLDPAGARVVKDLIRSLSKENITIFLSTHLINVVGELCTGIGIIDKGKLLTMGSPDEILKQVDDASNLEDAFIKLTGGIKSHRAFGWRQ